MDTRNDARNPRLPAQTLTHTMHKYTLDFRNVYFKSGRHSRTGRSDIYRT